MQKNIDIDSLGILRIFALMLVVLRHSFAPYIGMWNLKLEFIHSDLANILGNYISTISMPLYVFISGFLFSFLRNNLHKYNGFSILVRKKIKRLIVPYLFFAPIYIYLFNNFSNFKEFLIQFWQGAGHLWFLLMIFTVFLFFYSFESFFKKQPINGFFLVLILFFLYPGFFYIQLDPVGKAFQYLPYFYIGYFYFYHSSIVLNYLEKKYIYIFLLHTTLFTWSIIMPQFLTSPLLKSIFKGYMLLPMGILSISFLFLFFTKFKNLKNSSIKKTLNNINDNSYYIYIFHQPLLMTIFGWSMLQYWPPFIVVIGSFLIVFSVSLGVGNLAMKFKIGRKLIGAS